MNCIDPIKQLDNKSKIPQAPGDNGSAIAVCMDIIEKIREKKGQQIGLRIFFFDEEESGLKGSSAYATKYGVNGTRVRFNIFAQHIGGSSNF
jgi:Zn-dependent M28 family amino/carboxypeptidase